jgi:tRNA 2-thiouridine synthesizing protein A
MKESIETIDCFGDMCPLPVLKADRMLKKIAPGESFVLVTDHSCVVQSVEDKYKHRKVSITFTEVMNGVWEITFKKL